MKKLIMTLAALVAVTTASAYGLKTKLTTPLMGDGAMTMQEFEAPVVRLERAKTAAKAADEDSKQEAEDMPAEDPYTALGFNTATAGMQEGMAIQIEPVFVNNNAGNEITKVIFYTGIQKGTNVNPLKTATVFVTNDLTKDPVITQTVSCPGTVATRVEAILDTPYVLEAGKRVYVGVYYTLTSSSNLPIVIDYTSHDNDFGGWAGMRKSETSAWQWDNLAEQYGFVCVGAMVRGTFPEHCASITAIDGVPVSYQGNPFEVDFMIKNNGSDAISTLDIEYGMEGEALKAETVSFVDEPLPFNKTGIVSLLDVVSDTPAKSANVAVRITKVNGVANTSVDDAEALFPVTIVPVGKGFKRNSVVEEFTSISCTACPIGYTAMEYVHDNYPDGDFIPVGVHVNIPGRDPLTATSWRGMVDNLCSGSVPSAIFNRSIPFYPMPDNMTLLYNQYSKLPAIANVTAVAEYDKEEGTVSVDAKSSFSFDYDDGSKNFALAFAITENNVGPYTQQNGYSGANYDCYGWNELPSTVDLIYNDVARQLHSFNGLSGSVPDEIVAGEEYDFHYSIKLLQAIDDVNNINLIAYLINKNTREVMNAFQLKAGEITGQESGVENIVAGDNADAPVEYFNLQGVKVVNPEGGIFIRRQGSSTTKVAL